MTKHTPGPWFTKLDTMVFVDLEKGGLYELADFDNTWFDIGECKANATLVASAPDMVEALQKSQRDLTSILIDVELGQEPDIVVIRAAIARISKVLDKALGIVK
jgi:hypothetical protein